VELEIGFVTSTGGIVADILKPGVEPIVLLLLLQGWDDIGRNNPKYVSTPNLDR
jgi:hypothetical protein